MSRSAIDELKIIFKDEFGPEWCTFNSYDTARDGRVWPNDAVFIDRADGQRIKAETLHRVFALIPEVLQEWREIEEELLAERCHYRNSYHDED